MAPLVGWRILGWLGVPGWAVGVNAESCLMVGQSTRYLRRRNGQRALASVVGRLLLGRLGVTHRHPGITTRRSEAFSRRARRGCLGCESVGHLRGGDGQRALASVVGVTAGWAELNRDWRAGDRLDEMMRTEPRQPPVILAGSTDEDGLHRRLRVVVDAPGGGHPAVEGKRPVVSVEHHLLRLAEMGAHEHSRICATLTATGSAILDGLVTPVELVGLARIEDSGMKACAGMRSRSCRHPFTK